MPREIFCWYCDFFVLNSGVAGNCRRHAPKSHDYQSSTSGGAVFASIEDATIDWCGEYKPARDERSDPPA